ncbi:hypothetical protein GLAREA_00822 [Glarea lozoyensis ATCC 20868]|uniref:Retrotransposon Copia-like N-terminal domain-containing protein n=1 Tax=Glarea lozoyensis (strain ATCC 20868 / MF5171) TaxID=1116229 RepID=S3CTC2_GLAL2|nr:uncharacterized protein GLAREA_00822 [Glarea lozoyensis ATCC 20868]EPE29662.1 hypothetical protein GLAREA_00822 [Glarea lozoyensis ATCC 20868]
MNDHGTPDEFMDLERLAGQSNYLRWSSDFKLIAQCKGVWSIIAGEEEILAKPNRSDYFESTVRTSDRLKSKEPAVEKPSDQQTPSDQSARIAEYRLDLDEYEDNERRARLAMMLIIYWTDPSIRGTLLQYDTPAAIWKVVKDQYQM